MKFDFDARNDMDKILKNKKIIEMFTNSQIPLKKP